MTDIREQLAAAAVAQQKYRVKGDSVRSGYARLEFIGWCHGIDFAALQSLIAEQDSLLKRCAVAASDATSGNEGEDITAVGRALGMDLADIPCFINDRFAEMECRIAEQDAEIKRLKVFESQARMQAGYAAAALKRQSQDFKDQPHD